MDGFDMAVSSGALLSALGALEFWPESPRGGGGTRREPSSSKEESLSLFRFVELAGIDPEAFESDS